MRISVNYDNGQVFQHFGMTKMFKIFDVENGTVTSTQMLPASGEGHGTLAVQLSENKVDVAICGGLGTGMLNALQAAGIQVCANVSGDVDEAVKAYLNGNLSYNTQAHACGGHHHHH